MLCVRVLGPIGADIDGAPVHLGSPRQRALLALLLTSRGGVVPVDRLTDRLWRGRPPHKATASLHVHVSNLRRVLEPGRPPRGPAGVLVSTPPGYALRLPEDAVDAWRFEAAVRRARTVSPAEALPLLEEALGWWRGPAYGEWAGEEWAGAEVARLSELRTVAREFATVAALRAGRIAEAVPGAESLVRDHPLREEGWRLLALALWASGRQAEALAELHRAGTLIADELGLGPGDALTEVETALRTGRTEVLHAVVPEPGPAALAPAADELFVGRDDDLRALDDAARAARTGGGVVLVTGEAGAGKSALLARFRGRLLDEGWTVVVGRCPESDGAPPAWAWAEALGALARRTPPADPEALGALLYEQEASSESADPTADGPGRDAVRDGRAGSGRFRLHQAFSAWLRTAAGGAPLAVIIDDLHRADGETLALLERSADLAGAPVLVITAYRPTDAGDRLTNTLAELARRSPHRLVLGGLPAHDVGTLVTSVCGTPVGAATVTALTERTGGNPFYVRESARLLAAEGVLVAISEVPQGIRDVLRRRLRQLPTGALAVLQLASVAGQETEVSVLAEAADVSEHEVLDGLEAGVMAGLLTEPAPGRVRFAHTLVRDTLYTDLVGVRRARLHTRLAEVLRRLRPDDAAALAHHFARSGTAQTASLAADYSLRAAELAERRYAHDTAVELLDQAIECFALIPSAREERPGQLVFLLGRLLRAQIRAGAIVSARSTLQRAIETAEVVGSDDLVSAADGAWNGPPHSLSGPHGLVTPAAVDTFVDRLTARADLDPAVLARRASASADGAAASRAARRQLTVARAIGDPLLLACALTATAAMPHGAPTDRRELLAAEVRALGYAHDLPANRWVREHIGGMAAGARNDAGAVRRHAEEGLALAQRYRLVEAEAVSLSTMAMLAHVEGRFDESEALYTDVRDRLRHNGSAQGDFVHALGLITIRLSQDRVGHRVSQETDPLLRMLHAMSTPGVRTPPPVPGYLFGIALAIRSELALRLGDRAAARALIPLLSPVRDQLAGAASTSFACRPVAHFLGGLHRLLGDEPEADVQFAHAEVVARQWGSEHLAAAAREAAAGR
ncbi:BTAD domain-containing putative transcriptional regulator [Streptomyces sp. SID12488]|uniref:BTAD domain-containing putative transcriptional regulator n=1 Tax=Streptomyces sp. SID12488 TaxID=2706040 RepID=UPI0013DBD2D9|nr:BTAD domain-containing putative transcriptional regulator [Streptomyces sp. SID12488]NEA68780.1 AAA family ATPase [Streptomyces sp. SID12488]